jgi:hypothetical protein
MKKQYVVKLALAAVALGVTGLVGNAGAAIINLDTGANVATYASELAGAVTFSNEIAIPYARLTCDTNFITTAPDLVSYDTSAAGANAWTNVLVSGGINGKTLTYSSTVAAGGVAVAADDLWKFGSVAPVLMTISSGDNTTCKYELFESQAHWAAGTVAKSASLSVVKWSNGLLSRAADPTCWTASGCSNNATGSFGIIDTTAGSKKFTNNSTRAMVASVNVNDRSGDGIVAANGTTPVAFTTMVDGTSASTNLVVNGDFTAATKVWIETLGTGGCGAYASNKAAQMSADKLTATFSNQQIAAGLGLSKSNTTTTGNNGANICMEVSGTTVIPESTYTAVINLKSGTGYTIPASSNLGQVGRVVDNGSSDLLQMVLTPGGAYPGYVRISHRGADDGDISLRVYNDAGASVVVNLKDIAGQTTSTLAPYASTSQITLTDIYAAAQVVDPTFTVSTGKLRILVKSTSTTGVNASAYSTSKDGNSFVLLQE